MSPWRFARDLSLVLGAVLAVSWLVLRAVAVPWAIDGPSMMPALRPGDRVVVDLWTYARRAPKPGEIALFDGPGGEAMVKRIAAAAPPGAPSVPSDPALARDAALEPLVFVLGDNPGQSLDSRAFGPVPRSRFRGRIVFRYWPLSRAGPIR